MLDLYAAFARFDEEYLNFDCVEAKPHPRRDLCAFMLLDALVPGHHPLILAAEHDVVYLDIDCTALATVASEADIRTLVRCGVRFDGEHLSLFA